MRSWRNRSRGPFGRDFRLLWASRLCQSTGGSFMPVAMAFAVIDIGGSAMDLGTVLAATVIAQLVFLPLGGVWGDRLPRKALMIGANVGRAAVQGTLVVLLLLHQAHVWQVLLAGVLAAVGTGIFRPASTGLVAQILPAEQLAAANAYLSVGESTAAVIGPAAAGVLVAAAGAGWALLVYSLAFLGSAALLARIRVPAERAPSGGRSMFADLVDGWREVATRPWCWQNLIAHGLWNVGFSLLFVLGPVIAAGRLGGATAWGAVSSAMAVGSILGGLLAVRLRPSRPLVTGNLLLVLGAAPHLALAGRLPVAYLVLAMVLATGSLTILGAFWEAALQQLIPLAALSRVSAYDWFVSTALTPLGMLAATPLVNAAGLTTALLVGAGLITVPALLVVQLPGVRAVRRLPDGSVVGPAGEPVPAGIDSDPRPVATPREP